MQLTEQVERWIEANREEMVETLSKLIQIKTENLPPGGEEKPGQEFLYDELRRMVPKATLDVFQIDDVPAIREHPDFFATLDGVERNYEDRPIVSACLPGSGGGRSMVFSGHMDTMPASGQTWSVFADPFSGKVRDGKMYGRGSMDMKAGTLSGFYALKCLQDLGLQLSGDVYAESVVDEENGGANGTLAARLRYPKIDFGIVTEPTDLVAGIETLGGADWKASVSVEGPGGFAFGQEIPNAAYKLARLATALDQYDKQRQKNAAIPQAYDRDTLLRILTLQLCAGGSTYLESGSVPTKGHIYFWMEAFEYMKQNDVRRDLVEFMERELKQHAEFQDSLPVLEPVTRFLNGHRTDPEHPALECVRAAFAATGLEYRARGLDLACDAFIFQRAVQHCDVVVMGPSGGNPHGNDEYVELDSVFSLLRILVLSAASYCR